LLGLLGTGDDNGRILGLATGDRCDFDKGFEYDGLGGGSLARLGGGVDII